MAEDTVYEEQLAAWSFYGMPPNSVVQRPRQPGRDRRPVGEVGYVVGWLSDQLSRLDWRVTVDGSASWTVQTPDGETIVSDATVAAVEDAKHAVTASRKLLELVCWTPTQVKLIAANLFVAGECHYVVGSDDCWRVISVVKPKRKEILEDAKLKVRALWPHPGDPDEPGAPLFSALPILGHLDWLTRLAEAQSASRVSMRGVVGIADDMATANGKSFWDELQDATQQNMADPDSMAPVVLRGPAEMVKPSAGGMAGLAWVIPKFPYDDKIDERIAKAQLRLAYALPIPPEILTGLQAQSRATAFQVEDNAYRGHIEPPARLVAAVAAAALNLLLPGRVVAIDPDPTALLARRHSVQDVLDAFDRGAVSLAYLRFVLGIPEHAAPPAADLAILYRLKGRSDAQGTPDPSSTSQEPAPSQQGSLLAGLSEETRTLVAEVGPEIAFLLGAAQQATDRARERLGSMARTHEALRAELAAEVPNSQVAAALGVARLRQAGVDVEGCVRHGVASLAAEYPELGERLVQHVLDTLESDTAPMLEAR